MEPNEPYDRKEIYPDVCNVVSTSANVRGEKQRFERETRKKKKSKKGVPMARYLFCCQAALTKLEFVSSKGKKNLALGGGRLLF